MKVVTYDCVGRYHLIARCPACATGTVMTTCKDDFNGVTETNCTECDKSVAFCLIMKERKAWILGQPMAMVSQHVT